MTSSEKGVLLGRAPAVPSGIPGTEAFCPQADDLWVAAGA